LIAKVQKVFGLTSGKGKKFGLGQEKKLNTLLYQGWMGDVRQCGSAAARHLDFA